MITCNWQGINTNCLRVGSTLHIKFDQDNEVNHYHCVDGFDEDQCGSSLPVVDLCGECSLLIAYANCSVFKVVLV